MTTQDLVNDVICFTPDWMTVRTVAIILRTIQPEPRLVLRTPWGQRAPAGMSMGRLRLLYVLERN